MPYIYPIQVLVFSFCVQLTLIIFFDKRLLCLILEMNGLGYARATYDFESEQQEYVSLRAGDIVLVLEEVDDSWLKGKNHNKVGYFPRTYVESVQLPRISHGQRIFLATRPFAGEEDGDLSFDDGQHELTSL